MCTEYSGLDNRRVKLTNTQLQPGAVITWSNTTWYRIQHFNNRKLYSQKTPHTARAIGCLSWRFWRKPTEIYRHPTVYLTRVMGYGKALHNIACSNSSMNVCSVCLMVLADIHGADSAYMPNAWYITAEEATHTHTHIYYIPQNMYTARVVCVCYGLVSVNLSMFFQGYFTRDLAIIRFSECQWRDPEKCG